MDQIKVFLRQCVKHRFWIAVGISFLVPMIGYFVGVGSIVEATTKQEAEIKATQAEIQKYKSPGIPNNQYQPIVAQKKEALTKDVEATWAKLFSAQEPLLKWPEVVEAKFRGWGRKWPENVDRGQVQQTIYDYVIAYPDFVSRVYKTLKAWNPEDGTGVVVAPDPKTLLNPASFSLDAPPELGAVWAEQERLWVFTALLDVVAKVNDSVGAKDWDGAIIKQINVIEVGTPTAQDQITLAKGEALEPAAALTPPGGTPPTADPAVAGAPVTRTDTVYSIKGEGQQYKTLPIRMTVLVDQAHLPDFLVGLENSPMAIQVMEPEISKPLAPVVKPVYGETPQFASSGGPSMMNNEAAMRSAMGGSSGPNNNMMNNEAAMRSAMGGQMGGSAPPVAKKGTDNRSKANKGLERKNQEKESARNKAATKTAKVDQYYNIIEVTVYGHARFYNAPPPPPQDQPSTSTSTAPAPGDAPKAAQTPADGSGPAPEAPKEAGTPGPVAAPPAAAPNAGTPAPQPDGSAAKP